jgi:hypothetical protein
VIHLVKPAFCVPGTAQKATMTELLKALAPVTRWGVGAGRVDIEVTVRSTPRMQIELELCQRFIKLRRAHSHQILNSNHDHTVLPT